MTGLQLHLLDAGFCFTRVALASIAFQRYDARQILYSEVNAPCPFCGHHLLAPKVWELLPAQSCRCECLSAKQTRDVA